MTPPSASVCISAGIEQRLQQADEHLALAQDLRLGFRRLLDAQDDVGLGIQLGRRDDPGTGFDELLIGDLGTGTGTGFDEDFEPGSCQLAERFGYQGHAPFTRRGLPGDTDLHGHHLLRDTGPRPAGPRGTLGVAGSLADRSPHLRRTYGCGSDSGTLAP